MTRQIKMAMKRNQQTYASSSAFVAQLRARTGLSQYDFAKKYDLGLRAVQSWEQGKRVPGRYSLAILRRIFSSLLS